MTANSSSGNEKQEGPTLSGCRKNRQLFQLEEGVIFLFLQEKIFRLIVFVIN